VYVYRDTGDDHPAASGLEERDAELEQAALEREAEYWYGTGEPAEPEPVRPVRGPFEPLLTSNASAPEADSAVGDRAAPMDTASADTAPADTAEPGDIAELSDTAEPEADDPVDLQAQKLEQIKDFYLTAEAIGEENVDKHFDRLLAQQQALISEYFKQSGAIRGATGPGTEDTQAGPEGAGGGPDASAQTDAASADAAW
jgi:hypothetical protein